VKSARLAFRSRKRRDDRDHAQPPTIALNHQQYDGARERYKARRGVTTATALNHQQYDGARERYMVYGGIQVDHGRVLIVLRLLGHRGIVKSARLAFRSRHRHQKWKVGIPHVVDDHQSRIPMIGGLGNVNRARPSPRQGTGGLWYLLPPSTARPGRHIEQSNTANSCGRAFMTESSENSEPHRMPSRLWVPADVLQPS
jgi:hypothetical protein